MEKLKGGLNIVELFHGTTLAFKDLGLSVVCGLLDYFLAKSSCRVTVLVGRNDSLMKSARYDVFFLYLNRKYLKGNTKEIQ